MTKREVVICPEITQTPTITPYHGVMPQHFLIAMWWFACLGDPKAYAIGSLRPSGRCFHAGQVEG